MIRLTIFLLFISCGLVVGQQKLIISKSFQSKKYEFSEGEQIRFKLSGERYWSKAYILGLAGSKIRFHYNTIDIHEISEVDVRGKRQKGFVHKLSYMAIIGGLGFGALDQANRSLVLKEPGVDEVALGIAVAMVKGGLLLTLIKRRKVKIGKKFKLRISEI